MTTKPPEINKIISIIDNGGAISSGHGVFLKEDAKAGTVVSLYDGYVYTPEELEIYRQACHYNLSKADDERRRCGKYAIVIANLNLMINIPPEIDTPETFFPTLGQKVDPMFLILGLFYVYFVFS